jgi:hypothetical protein
MPDITSYNGIDMGDIASINGQDAPSGGGTASTAPVGSILYSSLAGLGTITISNHTSGYTNPNYQVSVSIGGSETVADLAVDHTLDSNLDSISGTLRFSDGSASTSERTVTVKAQEFGDTIQSSALTLNYTPSFAAYRYIRFKNVNATKGTSGISWFGIGNIRMFIAEGQSGTEYPTTDLSSATSETGIAITSATPYNGSTYDNWKAFDSSTSSRFWVTSGLDKWLTVEFEPATYSPAPTIKSMQLYVDYAFWLLIEGSDNNADWTELAHVQIATGTSNNGGNSNLLLN